MPDLRSRGNGTADRRWLHADERGSIVGVSDAAGNSIAIDTYDEFGRPGASNLGRFQYTGQRWIAELGLYDYKARMYAPALGRFLQTDPIGYGSGPNIYAYVRNDPVNLSDPLGLDDAEHKSMILWTDLFLDQVTQEHDPSTLYVTAQLLPSECRGSCSLLGNVRGLDALFASASVVGNETDQIR